MIRLLDHSKAAELPAQVWLIVLNWNGFADTHECLLSLQTVKNPRCHILVVDNGSSDDSLQRIIELHAEAEFVNCATNNGIAAGYNVGIETALKRGADYIVVMNNDLVCDSAFLEKMLATQAEWDSCGIIMPKIYHYSEPDVVWSAGAYARGLPSNITLRGKGSKDCEKFSSVVSLEFAPSCCLLLTRALCQQVKFDAEYFFYFDDWDFCRQARKSGFRIIFAPQAHLWHKISHSTQNSPKSQRWWRVLGQSCVRYHRKYHSLPVLAAYVMWVCARETVKGKGRSMPVFLSGIYLGLRARTIADTRPGWSS